MMVDLGWFGAFWATVMVVWTIGGGGFRLGVFWLQGFGDIVELFGCIFQNSFVWVVGWMIMGMKCLKCPCFG